MGQLFFKKPYQDAIRAGRKHTTIRRWNNPRVRAGQRAFSPGLGWLSIQSVNAIDLDALSDADAAADGFDSLSHLRSGLISMYPGHATDEKQWFRIQFQVEQLQQRRRRVGGG